MVKAASELEAQALRLPRRARARLAQRLISSLDSQADASVDKLWFQEAEHRLRELQSGKVVAIPAEKVIRKARAALQ